MLEPVLPLFFSALGCGSSPPRIGLLFGAAAVRRAIAACRFYGRLVGSVGQPAPDAGSASC